MQKKYYIISGLNLNDSNRGTAALSYGSFSFLKKFHNEECKGLDACNLFVYKNLFKFGLNKIKKQTINIGGNKTNLLTFNIWFIDFFVYKYIPLLRKLTKTNQILKDVKFVAAINGGDGFSDIYGTKTFKYRLFETNLAIQNDIPVIILPQTLGPFKENSNYLVAESVLKYAKKVYVRDEQFASDLNNMNVEFELTKDLSFYMEIEEFQYEIDEKAVGLNVSGLCYSNKFRDLSGEFDHYKLLISRIIKYFQEENVKIYLLAHSYNYLNPESDYSNDDMLAIREVYNGLLDKTNVYLIDENLNSPQTKYIISRFKFFIGTRMHANFAAIFKNVPVFGLAYSYKYEGSFKYMGLQDHYANVRDIEENEIESIVNKIKEKYIEVSKSVLE
jgi:polysaccharide pyruvyl transferase WcaK-like protein